VRAGITWLLDGDAVAGPKKDRAANAEPGLRAGDDEHLLSLAPHGASGAEVIGDRGAQRADAGGISIRHVNQRETTRLSNDESCPELVRELVECGECHAKGANPSLVAAERDTAQRSASRGAGQSMVVVSRAQHPVRRRGADERPGSRAAFDVPLVKQLLVRGEHWQSRNPQLGRERTRRRHTLSRAQHAVEDCFSQALIDLPVQRRLRVPLDWQMRKDVRAVAGFQDRAPPLRSKVVITIYGRVVLVIGPPTSECALCEASISACRGAGSEGTTRQAQPGQRASLGRDATRADAGSLLSVISDGDG
jgi:hypothetical protein